MLFLILGFLIFNFIIFELILLTFNDFIFLFMQSVKINRDVRVEFNSYYELFMKKLDIFIFWKKMAMGSKNLPIEGKFNEKQFFFQLKIHFFLVEEF